MDDIKELDAREHILVRPNMYIGSIQSQTFEDFIISDSDGKSECAKTTIEYIPGLVKIINEIIDNSVDIAIKTDFKKSNQVKVSIEDFLVSVEDNGPGIPVEKTSAGEWKPKICWGKALSGSNFSDENHIQIGANGVGSFCTNVWSKEFCGISDDGKNRYLGTWKNNATELSETVEKSKKHGVKVEFRPDLERFKIEKISDTVKSVIKNRLINLSMSYPKIKFWFNGTQIKISNFKNYAEMFGKPEAIEVFETDKYAYAVLPSDTDEFEQFSYVNGLKMPEGGQHIETFSSLIVNIIYEKLSKKYKTLKPADIRNRLFVLAFLKDFPNPKFNSQTKEKLTNARAEMTEYLGEKFEELGKRILKNSAIIDPIIEIFKIKEEFKRKQEMKELDKTKKVKNDNYIAPTKNKKYLLIVEGFSAAGGLMPSFGREDCGYFMLKGKPLNSWSANHQKFISNKELSNLYQVIKGESELEELPQGKLYEIDLGDEKIIASENDAVLINDNWTPVRELLENSKTENSNLENSKQEPKKSETPKQEPKKPEPKQAKTFDDSEDW